MSVWNPGRRDDDLDREIRDHLDLEAEERRARGESADDAAFAARRRFGNVGLVKEAVRATWRFARWDAFSQDIRYAWRGLRRSPAFTLTAVLSLGLGIGANTAVFALINALLLRSLPVTDPGRLMQLTIVDSGRPRQNFSYLATRTLAQQTTGLTGLCGFALGESFSVGVPGKDRRTTGTWMTGDCHRVLGVRFAAGRGFSRSDDQPDDARSLVAVASYDYWARELGGSDVVIGSQIVVDGRPVTIIGVTAPGFTGPNVGRTADITLPVAAMPQLRPKGPSILGPEMNWLRLFGRLDAGVSAEQAEAGINVVWSRVIDVVIAPREQTRMRSARLALSPGGTGWSELRTRFTRPLVVLMSIVGLVLLIGCANLASLLLARASARRREFAVRLAIGAGRGRLVRQAFTESVLLALIGALVAIAFAELSGHALLSLLSAGRAPIVLDVRPDATVLGFTLAIALFTSILFGLAPAIRAGAVDESSMLRTAAASRTRRGRVAATLIVAQAALSLVLVVGGILFARTLFNLLRVDPGFRRDGITLVSVDIPRGSRDPAREPFLIQQTLDDLRGLPGVTAASVSGTLPMSGGAWTLRVGLENDFGPDTPEAEILAVSPSYFSVFGIPLRSGRDFARTDGSDAQPVVVVNESFLRERLGSTASPVGKRLRIGSREQPFVVVGVVGNVTAEGPRKPMRPAVYLSFFQGPSQQFGGARLALFGNPTSDAIRERIRALSPAASVNAQSFREVVDASLVNERLLALLSTFFGALALILAAIGLYGLLAFSVSRRVTEIGVRTALGATPAVVVRLILSDALRLATAGILVGIPLVYASTRLVGGMLFGLTPTDPSTIAIGVGLVAVTALIAGLLPAIRAVRINPIAALKSD